MRYESLLASRYIKAQKRQSVFTVISIAAAVAVITMIFLLYSVTMTCIRNVSYSASQYHLSMRGLTEEQGYALQNEEYVRSVKLDYLPEDKVSANILFDGDIGNAELWLQNAAQHIGAEKQFELNNYEWNTTLMNADGIGDDAKLSKLRIFSMFFLFAVLLAFALRMIIDTAFEVSSKERERHYGVLQSVGATPEQIVKIITSEGLRLCVIAVPVGLVCGIFFAYVMYRVMLSAGFADIFRGMTAAQISLPFSVDLKMLLLAALVGTVWVFLSAYGVGMRIIRKTPMEAITTRTNDVKKVRRHTLSGLLFGISGSIASRNARRQKKRFSVTVLTLTVSITLFSLFGTLMDSVERTASAFIGVGLSDTDSDFAADLLSDNYTGRTWKDSLKEIEDSGLFTDIRIYANENASLPDTTATCRIEYVNREGYEGLFKGQVPVPYEQLVQTGGYVVNKTGGKYDALAPFLDADTVSVSISYRTLMRDQLTEHMDRMALRKASETDSREHTLTLIGKGQVDTGLSLVEHAVLIGALETYEDVRDTWYTDYDEILECGFSVVSEKKGEYSAALDKKAGGWIQSHPDALGEAYNAYHAKGTAKNIISAIRAGVLLLNVLIALTALINLMNIISTGLANRRSELASLQCVGMTDKQLDRMALIEIMQFTVTAAVISAIICAVVMLGTESWVQWLGRNAFSSDERSAKLFSDMTRMNHAAPFVRIAAAAVTAAAAGCITSLVMLRSQNTDSLSEQIRGTEMKLDTKKTHILRNGVIAAAAVFVLTVTGLRIYSVAAYHHDRKEYDKAGYLNLVDADGTKVNVYSTGAEHGRHTIVGLSGMGVNCFPVITTELNNILGKENTVVYPDRAGYGFSDDSRKAQTVQQVVEDYRTGLQSAGFSAPYVLMGHSYGSFYALWWEANYPDEVEAIILLDGTYLTKNDFWWLSATADFPSEQDAKSACRRMALRTWLGLDRLSPQENTDGVRTCSAILTDEEIHLWKLSENRSNSAASLSEILLEESQTQLMASVVQKTDTPKLYFHTMYENEEQLRENYEFMQADFEAAGREYDQDPALAAQAEWKQFGWYFQKVIDCEIKPFAERIGNCRLIAIGGDHGTFYVQKADEVGAEILDFLSETTQN